MNGPTDFARVVANLSVAVVVLLLVVWAITRVAYATVRDQRNRDAGREYQRQPLPPPPPPSEHR